MLAKRHRFHGHQAVRRIYREGRAVRSSLMSLHIFSDNRTTNTKAAIVVSRKISKSAVRRNRIRRRLYEQVRRVGPLFKNPTEVVFTVYKEEIATMPIEKLEQEFNGLIHKAKLL